MKDYLKKIEDDLKKNGRRPQKWKTTLDDIKKNMEDEHTKKWKTA